MPLRCCNSPPHCPGTTTHSVAAGHLWNGYSKLIYPKMVHSCVPCRWMFNAHRASLCFNVFSLSSLWLCSIPALHWDLPGLTALTQSSTFIHQLTVLRFETVDTVNFFCKCWGSYIWPQFAPCQLCIETCHGWTTLTHSTDPSVNTQLSIDLLVNW